MIGGYKIKEGIFKNVRYTTTYQNEARIITRLIITGREWLVIYLESTLN